MPLKIPSLTESGCIILSLCGRFTSGPEKKKKRAKGSHADYQVAKTRVGGTPHFVRLINDRGHLHIDLAQTRYFGDEPPTATTTITEIRKTTESIIGKEIETDADALFMMPRANFPTIIRSTLIETKAGNLTLKMTGGKLSVGNAPVYRISWGMRNDDEATVFLESRIKTTITDSYLDYALNLLSSTYRTFIAGDGGNESQAS